MRFKGDFYYNVKILEIGGDLIVCRRPKSGVNSIPHNYTPCKFCFGFTTMKKLSDIVLKSVLSRIMYHLKLKSNYYSPCLVSRMINQPMWQDGSVRHQGKR